MTDILVTEPGYDSEASDQAKAITVGEALNRCYPNHFWVVSFQGHALIVRHMLISGFVKEFLDQDGFGFLLPNAATDTPQQLAHAAMHAGGQMLEAFGMPRGAWHGEEPVIPAGWVRKQERFQ